MSTRTTSPPPESKDAVTAMDVVKPDKSEEASSSKTEDTASSKKRPRSPSSENDMEAKKREALVSLLEVKKPEGSRETDKLSFSSLAAASQLSSAMGWNGLGSLLSLALLTSNAGNEKNRKISLANNHPNGGNNSGSLPTNEQVLQAAIKALNDAPPFVHLSKTDSAPQLVIHNSTKEESVLVNDRLACKQGEMKGYRMTRATHGVAPGAGHYYYEVILLEPPSARELVNSLPPNVRLGKKLQREMEEALKAEGQQKMAFGAHVRLGWSMRTGDLQAPVGYDKWSYGLRDIQGSKIHASKRDDDWGGEEFGPGDVIGCAISMEDETENEIRFFKNGLPMGEFVLAKGKREGGVAFTIPDGVYYPAVSLYMGATVKLNFGPHFICPPRKLPTTLSSKTKQPFLPMSSICKPPLSVEEAKAKVTKEQKTLFFRKADNSAQQKRFLELVETEVAIRQEAYQKHRRKHLLDVMEERKKRNLKCDDLEDDEYFDNNDGTKEGA